eukprot:gene34820-22129_t
MVAAKGPSCGLHMLAPLPADGGASRTREEFVAVFGGLDEWNDADAVDEYSIVSYDVGLPGEPATDKAGDPNEARISAVRTPYVQQQQWQGEAEARLKRFNHRPLAGPTAGDLRLLDALAGARGKDALVRSLAGPQVGDPRRVVAIDFGKEWNTRFTGITNRTKKDPNVLYMPRITWRSEEMFSLWEECPCYPGELITYELPGGTPRSMGQLPRGLSALFQRQIDILDG